MSYKYVQDLTSVNRDVGTNSPKYIVIHYTGNTTDTAAANANYFRSTYRGASAHYFVDEKNVYQVVKDTDSAWHVGRNFGSNNLFGTVNNRNSIGIEMCSTSSKIADGTYKNTVELTKSLMKKYGIKASNVVRHWDVCSKVCPGWNGWGANGQNSSIWQKFKQDIVKTSDEGWKKNDKGWWYKNANGSYPRSAWLKLDTWYYFDEDGYAKQNSWLFYGGYWYYFNDDCRMRKGWLFKDNEWYYLGNDPEGVMIVGWKLIDGKWYYFRREREEEYRGNNEKVIHPLGSAVTREKVIDGYSYYFHPHTTDEYVGCSMAIGWVYLNGKWRYYNKNYNCQPVGSMLLNHWVKEEKNGKMERYYLKDNGMMASNEEMTIGGVKYKFTEDGRVV